MQVFTVFLFTHDACRLPLDAGSLGIESPGHVFSVPSLLHKSSPFYCEGLPLQSLGKLTSLSARRMLDTTDIALLNLRVASEGVFSKLHKAIPVHIPVPQKWYTTSSRMLWTPPHSSMSARIR
jgi:hypothetical protein